MNVAVAEVGLQRPRIVARVGQGKATGMAKHMSVDLNPQLRLPPSAFDHSREARGAEGCPTLTDKHKLSRRP